MEGLGNMNKNQSNVAPPKKQTFSWKTFIIALIVAFFLNIFISAIADVEPRKNIMWTVLWIYLSIEAWKFWKWKALLPYPLCLVLTLIFLSVITATGFDNLSWSHISVAVFLNIGGLITFYLLLSKSQHNQDIAAGVLPPEAYATVDMIAKERTTQLQERTRHKPTIENKATSKEKAILEELRNESILTSNEFIEKMAVVEAREEAERFEKLLCSTTEPFINKMSELKNAGLLNEQEYEQKKRKIIEKNRAELLDEQEQKQKKLAMIKERFSISEDDYRAMNAQTFDYLDIIDKKKKLGLIKTQDEETNEIFRLQEIQQELVECNEICFKCYAFRKLSDKECSACGQVFNEE